jgi:hypothetical protein
MSFHSLAPKKKRKEKEEEKEEGSQKEKEKGIFQLHSYPLLSSGREWSRVTPC